MIWTRARKLQENPTTRDQEQCVEDDWMVASKQHPGGATVFFHR